MEIVTILPLAMLVLSLLLCPLLAGVLNRVNALAAGRRGQPLLQPYFDIVKLARENCRYPENVSWIFQAGPVVALGGALAAAALTPFGADRAVFAFTGDFLLWLAAFAMARVFIILAVIDSGSAFATKDGSRAAWIGTLVEPVALLSLAAVAMVSGQASLSVFLGFFHQANGQATPSRWRWQLLPYL